VQTKYIPIKYARPLLVALMLYAQPEPRAFAENLCLASGYTIGFFNGVWNTPVQAADGLASLRDLNGDTFNDEPIQYEGFYNHTGSTAGGTGLQDIAEVFEQRAAEIDASGELGKRWEFFWETLAGKKPFTDKLIELFPSAGSLFSQLFTDISSKITAGWSYLISNPPTESDYATHNARLDALAVQRQKLMLVAHSQGNLFVNHAYDHIISSIGPNSVMVAHIAPASPTLRGEYLLANIDLVINGLRIQGLNSVPAVNLTLPTSMSDISGHTLVGTYMDASRPGRAAVASMINRAMGQLTTPETTGNAGSFTVTLSWDGIGDVDLHSFEPNGAHAYYIEKAGLVGYLDVDNIDAFGPEHYYASCDSNILQTGVYHFGINNFANATGRMATVQVASSKEGVLATKTLGVGAELGTTGNQSPISVFDITVTKDVTTGKFSFAAN